MYQGKIFDGDYAKAFGVIVARARFKKGLTPKKLAKMINISVENLSLIEKGQYCLSCKLMHKFSAVVGVTPQDVMFELGFSPGQEKEFQQSLLSKIRKDTTRLLDHLGEEIEKEQE